jgi:hypothetical protein
MSHDWRGLFDIGPITLGPHVGLIFARGARPLTGLAAAWVRSRDRRHQSSFDFVSAAPGPEYRQPGRHVLYRGYPVTAVFPRTTHWPDTIY